MTQSRVVFGSVSTCDSSRWKQPEIFQCLMSSAVIFATLLQAITTMVVPPKTVPMSVEQLGTWNLMQPYDVTKDVIMCIVPLSKTPSQNDRNKWCKNFLTMCNSFPVDPVEGHCKPGSEHETKCVRNMTHYQYKYTVCPSPREVTISDMLSRAIS